MTTAAAPFVPPRRFENAAEWLHALGGVPLERIVFDPLPGTATEADLLRLVEQEKRLCELIDGTLVEKPVGYREGVIAAELAAELINFAKPSSLPRPAVTLDRPPPPRVAFVAPEPAR